MGKIAIVTGANKGIGLAIVRHLALQHPTSSTRAGPLLIYLTARSHSKGASAVATLSSDPHLQRARALHHHGGLTTIKYLPLDIADPKSVQELVEYLKKTHPEGIDIVVNNAGVAFSGYDLSIVTTTLRTNYTGTLLATLSLLPLLRPAGRLVNLGSMSGHLNKYSPELQSRFLAVKTPADVTALMDEYVGCVARGDEKERGWIRAGYAVSKAGIIALTRVVAGEEGTGKGRGAGGVLVNVCCPGYVRTGMVGGVGAKSPDEGAQTPVLLCLGDIGGRSGGFWQDEREIEW